MITVIQKDNTISINGKLFQVDSYISASNPSGDLVAISVSGQGVVIRAPYNLYQDASENAFGANASQVVTALNAIFQSSNPSGLIKSTDKITSLAEVENFTAAKQGEFLAVGSRDGAMVASGKTADSFLEPGDNITVGDITAYGNITIPVGQGNLNVVGGTIDAGGAIRSGSFLSGDYIRLEGSTDDIYDTILQVVDPTQTNTITFPNTSGTVALTSDIPSGNIAVDSIDFNLSTPPNLVDGRLAYDADKDTLIFGSEHGEIAIGETYKPVYNNTGSTISKGTVLKATGVSGERFTVGLFDASSGVDEELYLIGIAQADISDQTEGVVVSEGYVKHLNTSSYSVGDILYASETAGAFTSTKPSSPNLGIPVAMVTDVDSSNGTIYVRLTQYAHLNELHDLNIVSPNNGHILRYQSSNGTWINSSVLDVSTVNVSGTFTAGSIFATNTIITPSIFLTGESSSISVTGVTGEDLSLSSKGNITVFLDSDNNETSQKFAINDPSTTERFSVDDSGVVTINSAYTLPSADGTSGQVLTTNGSGAASWEDVSFLDLSDAPASYIANNLVVVNSSGDGLTLSKKRSPYVVNDVIDDQNRLFQDPGLSTASYRIVDFINDSLASASSSTAKNFLGWYDGSKVIIEGMVNTNGEPPQGFVAGNPIWLELNGRFAASPPTTSGYYSRVVGYYVGDDQGGNALIYFSPSKDWIQIS